MEKPYKRDLAVTAAVSFLFAAMPFLLHFISFLISSDELFGFDIPLAIVITIFAAAIALDVAIIIFICDAVVRLNTLRERLIWILALVLGSVVAFPIYLIVNGNKSHPKHDSEIPSNSDDMPILAFLPQVSLLVFVAFSLFTNGIFVFITVPILIILLILEIAAVIRFLFDICERFPKGKERCLWVWLIALFAPFACPIYVLKFIDKMKIQYE